MQIQNNFYLYLFFFTITLWHFNCKAPHSIDLREGDLLFQDLDSSPLCDGIEKVTTSIHNLNFSHIGITTIINNKYYVLEAFSNGVDTVSLKTFLKRSLNKKTKPKVIVGRLKKEYSKLIPKAIERGIHLIGKEYDSEFKINNDKFYCSELIYDIFLDANKGKPFFNLQPMTYKYDGNTLDVWINYFEQLNIKIPENEPGINPGGISLSNKIEIIYNYMD